MRPRKLTLALAVFLFSVAAHSEEIGPGAQIQGRMDDAAMAVGACIQAFATKHSSPKVTGTDIAEAAIAGCQQQLSNYRSSVREWLESAVAKGQLLQADIQPMLDKAEDKMGSVAIRDRLVCCRSFLATGTVNDRGTEQGHQADALPARRDAHLRALVCGLPAEPAPPGRDDG